MKHEERKVDNEGLEPLTSPCKGNVLANYTTKPILVGILGLEPRTTCSQSKHDTTSLHPYIIEESIGLEPKPN